MQQQGGNALVLAGIHPSHAHELRANDSLEYSCDVCRGKDSRRYKCTAGCNYDVCGACWDKASLVPTAVAEPPPSINPATSGIHGSHAHELKLIGAGGYSCDVCRGKDERRYKCANGCNYDVCGKCWDNGPVTLVTPPVVQEIPRNNLTIGIHSSHGHELKMLEQATGYSCDVCRGKDDRRFKCAKGCNYDVCGKCWDKGPVTPYTPPTPVVIPTNNLTVGVHSSHRHHLKTYEQGSNYTCDVCRKSDERRFKCGEGCNYDVCGKCWDKGPVTPYTPPPVEVIPTNTLTIGVHSSHRHHLKTSEQGSNYTCDVCRKSDERRFKCGEGCNYDVCGKCWDKGPVTPYTPPAVEVIPTNTLTIGVHSSHRHHLKASDQVSNYMCDVCRKSDERRFKCGEGCNYDVCGKCWDKGPVTPYTPPAVEVIPTNTLTIGVHSSHRHHLKTSDQVSGYMCDVCRKSDERRFQCAQGCNYDVCGKCWDKGPVTPYTPPAAEVVATNTLTLGLHSSHRHNLKASDQVSNYMCDVCRKSDERRFQCAEGCNYDVCGKCWDKGPVTPVQQPQHSPQPQQQQHNTLTAGTHASHAHELQLHGSTGGYSCDVCRGKDDRRYNCTKGCNYDVCGKCWDNGPVTPPVVVAFVSTPVEKEKEKGADVSTTSSTSSSTKPLRGRSVHHSHTLQRMPNSESFRCDVCRTNKSGYPYHCLRKCNWDMCEECWQTNDITESTEIEAPLLSLEVAMFYLSSGFDVDEGSLALINSQPQGWKLHSMHPLAENKERAKWSCDNCKADGTNFLKRFTCTKRCNFDLCNKCYTGGENEDRSATEPVLIAPGPPEITGLPFRSEFDETNTKFWSEFREPYVGQIVFSKKPVERFFYPDVLEKEFVAGESINCRAVWPRAFRNYPLGHKKSDPSQPVYGPKFILSDAYGHLNMYATQVFVSVTVDGKPVTRNFEWGYGDGKDVISDSLLRATEVGPKPPGSFSGSRNDDAVRKYAKHFAPETVDFWAMNQSMTFGLVRDTVNQSDDWEKGMLTFMKHLSTLSPGEHTVEVALRFRLVGNTETIFDWMRQGLVPESECWPNKLPTPMSHPLAKGSFKLRVPGQGEVGVTGGVELVASPFPKRKTSLSASEADRVEALIADWMRESPEWGSRRHQTERILKIVITGDWCKLMKEHECKDWCPRPCPKWEREPWRYNLDFQAVVYRSPVDGWKKEMPCAVFNLGAFAYDKNPQSKNDLIGVGVAGHHEFDVDLVPDSAFAEAGVKRCPESMRGGFI